MVRARLRTRRDNQGKDDRLNMEANDTHLGAYVYCASHVGPHASGWCTVGLNQKLGLPADNADDARAWCQDLGLPVYGYCPVCYAWRGNEPHSICQDHKASEYAAATLRREDLRRYLWERQAALTLDAETAKLPASK